MTKKDLIEILKDVDDNTEIITVSHNYELRGNYVKARAFKGNYKEIKDIWMILIMNTILHLFSNMMIQQNKLS